MPENWVCENSDFVNLECENSVCENSEGENSVWQKIQRVENSEYWKFSVQKIESQKIQCMENSDPLNPENSVYGKFRAF